MRQIRNWYQLLEQSGLTALDLGPGDKPGTLSANVTRCPYYYPPGIPYGYKGVTITASQSRIVSPAAAFFNAAQGSIEMLVKPSWNYNDGLDHFFFDTYEGSNLRLRLNKGTDNKTYLFTGEVERGNVTYPWTANVLYHIVLNWGINKLYINKVLEKTFNSGGLGAGSYNLYIGDACTGVNHAFSGNIYYFIVRDIPLTLAEITTFYNFFVNQYT